MLRTARIRGATSAPALVLCQIRPTTNSRDRPPAGALIEDRFPLASEATGASGLAERYAAALFDIADERHALDPVAEDLRQLRTMLKESGDLSRLLRSPVLSRDAQARHEWAALEPFELFGRRVVILGLGSIGTAIADRLRPFRVELD